ncbi:hypothetical protein EDB81DRAFT_940322 [Dactylonectria macrodidyma]|uniref:N-acetyltransferase domain-containing protein n=1 Tax=Dactylonectria macrodidyma TaxID=307937 RepID=A0A9P9FVQ0_9HYPO|nr:hypothetical protein EDB81DRAFT_940322 [Dactylonectria macrodidyma]
MPRRGRMKIRSNLIKRRNPCTRISHLDVEHIAETITVPAMQNGPLFKTMFPKWSEATPAQKREVDAWYAQLLLEAVETSGHHSLLQLHDWETYPLGFCGWTLDWRVPLNEDRRDERKKAFPELLDCDAWLSLIEKLKVERDKALEGIDEVYRMSCTFVQPKHQRKGVGSKLLKGAFEYIDEVEMPVFLVAPPDAVAFYAKFGFEVVSTLETEHGAMSTMFRKARLKADKPEEVEELSVLYSEVESDDDGKEFKGGHEEEVKKPGVFVEMSDDDCDEHWL